MLLVMCNLELDNNEKVDNILGFITFDCELNPNGEVKQGQVTIDEFQYLFQLAYMLLSRVSDIDPILTPQASIEYQVPRSTKKRVVWYGTQTEVSLLQDLYDCGSLAEHRNEVDYKLVYAKLIHHLEVQKVLTIFKNGNFVETNFAVRVKDVKMAEPKKDGEETDNIKLLDSPTKSDRMGSDDQKERVAT